MTASTVSTNLPRTALCGTCGGTYTPPALSSRALAALNGATCGKCEQAAQEARSAAQRDAYGAMCTTGTRTA